MKIGNSKYDLDQIVFIKNANGVSMAKVCAIGIDMSKEQRDGFTFVYLLWESDRKDWAGHHVKAYESNIGATFEEAYYNANPKFPWDITEDLRKKDIKEFFKTRSVT